MQSVITKTTSTAASLVAEIEDRETETNGAKIHKWTQKEYYQMAELGFFLGKRVELIEGEIIEMSPMKTAHATALSLAIGILTQVFSKGFVVRTQLPMSFSKTSAPEPDVAIVAGGVRDFADSHPKTAELIIEISDTTLRFDRTVKAALYAQNNIRDYCILNLKSRCLEVYRQPKKDKKLGHIYTETRIITEDDEFSPLTAPEAKIKIANILP